MGKIEYTVLTPDMPPDAWAVWDRLVASSAEATPYHSKAWVAALCDGLGHDVRVHAAVTGDAAVAGVVLRHAKRGPVVIGRKPWSTAYNGMIAASTTNGAASYLYERLRQAFWHVRLVGLHQDTPQDWQCHVTETPVLDVSDLASLWSRFDRRVRQRVRKAQSLGVTCAASHDFDSFAGLYADTYRRQGLPMAIAPTQIAATLRRTCEDGPFSLHLATTIDREPAAALVVGRHGARLYFALAASHAERRKTDAMTLLWWTVMQEASSWAQTVDLVGLGTDSIGQFKTSFSPRFEPVHEFTAYGTGFRASLRLARCAGIIEL